MQRSLAVMAAFAISHLAGAHAQTLDYYRFENGVAGGNATTLLDSGPEARNGTVLHGASAPTYSSRVPLSSIPQTGAANTVSLEITADEAVDFAYAFPFQTLKSATLELWIKPSSLSVENDYIWTNDGTNTGDANRFNIFIQANTGIPVIDYREPNGTIHVLGNATIGAPAGKWSYLAFVKKGSTYEIFMKNSATGGELKRISLVTDTSPNLPTSTGWTVNGRAFVQPLTANQFTGGLDEIRLSKVALPTTKLLAHKPPSGAVAKAGPASYPGAGSAR